MKKTVGLTVGLLVVACGGAELDSGGEELTLNPVLQVVHEQMDAFNRHDVPALAAGVAPDFVWFGFDGDSLTVEVRGREAFAEGMRGYFASLPTARSEVEDQVVSGNLVAIRERASWSDGNGTERSQVALGVYEVRDGLIQRVWYYPAQR